MADDITIQIGARNRAKKVMDDVRRDVGAVGRKVGSVTSKLKSFFGVFAGAAAATTVVSGLADSLQRIDETAKTSRKLGIMSDELIGLRLAAAEFSGMASGQVDVALQRMTRRLSEAADKTKAVSLTMDGSTVQLSGVRKAIDELGLSAVQLNRIGPAAAFREIAERIKSVQNPADQLRIAFQLFDSEGASLVNTLNAGGVALDEMKQKAADLGLTFTDLEGQQVEEANDAIHEMTSAWDGLKTELTVGVGPALSDTANLLTEIIKGLTNPVFGDKDRLREIFRQEGYIPETPQPIRLQEPSEFAGESPRERALRLLDNARGMVPSAPQGPEPTNARERALRLLDNVPNRRPDPTSENADSVPSLLKDFARRQVEAFGDVANNLRWQVQTEAAIGVNSLMNKANELMETQFKGAVKEKEKAERSFDPITGALRQSTELFAKQSRTLTGAGEQRRNIVVERMERVEKAVQQVGVAIKGLGQEGVLDELLAAQPDFIEADVEVITR